MIRNGRFQFCFLCVGSKFKIVGSLQATFGLNLNNGNFEPFIELKIQFVEIRIKAAAN